MTSINFSASATSAIRALQSVNRDLSATQNRISTGYKINSAADNASVWEAAAGLRSDIKSYEAASASMDFGKGVYQTAAASADAVVSILTEMKTLITSNANSTLAALTNADTALAAMQARLKAVIADADVGGVNLLKGGAMPTVITAFSSSGTFTAATAITTVDFNANTTGYTGEQLAASFGTVSGTAQSLLNTTVTLMQGVTNGVSAGLATLNTVISNVSDYSARLSGAAKSIQSSQTLMSKISEIKNTTLSAMVDADFEEESAKLAALQVKQQLATQALSIANSSAQNVLRLFQ